MDIFIIRDGQQTGPFNEGTVQSLLRDGGLRSKDMAWRKGLPTWVPVGDLLKNGAEPPALAQNGSRSQPPRPASAKQKVFLRFLGATMQNDITREEAALAISDALENPKLQSRIAKWNAEKLRLHSEEFQDEIDYLRANRVGRFLELCQTEAAEVVKDVTKAHVQVLIEALDKKQSTWETDSRSALWDYFLPTVAQHFPQLVKDEWKGKLIFGGKSEVAKSIAKTSGALTHMPATPGPVHAAMRGIIYGVGVLAIAIGGHYLYKDSNTPPAAPAAAAKGSPSPEPPAPDPVPVPDTPLVRADDAALIGLQNPPPEPVVEPAPVVAAVPEPPMTDKPAETAPEPPKPEPPVAPPVTAAIPAFTPAPAPGEKPADPPMAPGVAAAPIVPATPKTVATLNQAIAVTLANGRVTLPAGTKLRILGYDGKNIRVAWNNNIFNVGMAATDVTDAVALAAPPPNAPPPPAALPGVPTAPKKPADPSSDL